MLTIALLGNTAAQQERLGRQLPFTHRFLEPGEIGTGRAEVVVALRFGANEAHLAPRLLHMPGAGTDAVDFGRVPADCTVCNVFEHEIPIAEYVLLAMLDWEIGYSAMTRAFTAEGWSEAYRTRKPHGELAGRSLGLIGVGHIGEAIASRAAALGMRVAGIGSRGRAAVPPFAWIGGPERLDELMAASDYVVVACPLTEQSRRLVSAQALAAMRPSGVLINVARGEIIDEGALFSALESGRIGGAVLDAWFRYPGSSDTVPPASHPFDRLPNARCTPHASAWTGQLFERRYAVIADNIRRFAAGEPLRNVVRAALERQEGTPCLT